jgi:hypothetical protein
MMDSLKDRANKELVQAQKERDETKMSTLRLFLAAVHNREIEKGKDATLTEDESSEVLRREAKKRKEAMEIYAKAGRPELAEKEEKELKILENYLPPQLDEASVSAIVDEAIKAVQPSGPKDFGRVMGEAMKKLKGVADTGLVSRLIKEKTEKPA